MTTKSKHYITLPKDACLTDALVIQRPQRTAADSPRHGVPTFDL